MKIGRLRTLQSSKKTEERRKALVKNVSYVSVSVLVFVIILISISWLPFLRIKTTQIDGSETINTTEIQAKVDELILGTYLYTIPRSSIFVYPKDNIQETILNIFSKIDTVDIDIDGFTTLNITVTERAPEVMVCEGFREDENSDTCYYADKLGIVYEKAPILTDGVYYKYYLNNNEKPIVLGQPFVNIERFKELQDFVSGLNNSKVVSTGMLISDDGSYELYVNNIKEGTAVVYFDDRTDFDKTLSNLITFWNSALDKKIGTTTISNFEYINLRFGNNVFYLTK